MFILNMMQQQINRNIQHIPFFLFRLINQSLYHTEYFKYQTNLHLSVNIKEHFIYFNLEFNQKKI